MEPVHAERDLVPPAHQVDVVGRLISTQVSMCACEQVPQNVEKWLVTENTKGARRGARDRQAENRPRSAGPSAPTTP